MSGEDCLTEAAVVWRFVETEGGRREREIWRDGVLGAGSGALGGVETLESRSSALPGNDEGGRETRRFAAADGDGTAGVDGNAAMLFLLLLFGTTVVTPLAALVTETIEYARGFSPLDDVPAVVERNVVLDTREGVSDGGRAGI